MHAIWLIPAVFVVLSAVGRSSADSLDDAVRAEMDARHIPGLAFAVVRDGRVVRTGAYGYANLEHRVPVSLKTRFPVHSVSKQFCAAAVLMAAEEGRLSLDDPMAKYLDGVLCISFY
jgi:CubicO group peptidase (beta-lactamase class C family)